MGHGIKDCRVHLVEEKPNNIQSNITTKHNQLYVATLIIVDSSDNTWYVDTYATNHMTHDIESFVSYNKWEKRQFVYLGDSSTHEIIGQGEVSIKRNDGSIKEVTNVLHVLGIQKNLFLVKQFDHAGGEIFIESGNCFLKNSHGQQIVKCILEANLYKLSVTKPQLKPFGFVSYFQKFNFHEPHQLKFI